MLLKNATYMNADFQMVQGDLIVKEGRIKIGAGDAGFETMDCSGYYIIPGLYNAHFHGYSLTAKGITRDMKIEEWGNDSPQGEVQQRFFENVDRLSGSEYKIVLLKAYIEMVKQGIVFASESEPGEWPDMTANALQEAGLKGFVDTYGRIEEFYDRQTGTVSFGTHLLEEEDITDEALRSLEESKSIYDSLYVTHCMENDWRKNLIFGKYEKSSVELYHKRGLLDDQTVLFHGVHLNGKDIDLLAEAGSSVVHCPVTNLWTGGGIAPVGNMLKRGANVCLGTDYGSVDMWETMRIAYLLLKTSGQARQFSAEDVFRMAAANGAKAYGKHANGAIAEGYAADLVFIRKDPMVPDIETADFSTVVHNLLMETQPEQIRHVMIDGNWILFDRKLLTVDEHEVNRGYQHLLGKLYSGIHD